MQYPWIGMYTHAGQPFCKRGNKKIVVFKKTQETSVDNDT